MITQGTRKGKIKPDDIIELSKINFVVHNCFNYWRQGHLTWGEMLATCVVALAHQNKLLQEHAKIEVENEPLAFISDSKVDFT